MQSDSNASAKPDEGISPVVPDASATGRARTARAILWVDILLFALLVGIAAFSFYRHAIGDLYSDEADYALASVRGFEANRWDRSDIRREPDRLVAARHFHAPLTVDLIDVAHSFGAADHTIRMPFVIAGGLIVGLVYLCGLALFDNRREIAIACALLVEISPPIVRMASHALPWAPIIVELLILLWCMTQFTNGQHWGWIVGCCAALGALFVTSEMFFVGAAGAAAAAPLIAWPSLRAKEKRRELLIGAGVGLAVFLAIAVIIWPSGLTGEAIKMLRHYIQMRHSESFPVNVGNRIFAVAPKWSYLYWYWNDYKPFTLCYAIGIIGLLGMAAAGKFPRRLVPLISLSILLLFAAHRAHIIGPEYLAHCLPFLTLLGGCAIYAASLLWRPLAIIIVAALAVPVLHWHPRVPLPGTDTRAQVSRWPFAAKFLAARWKPGDKIVVGSQPVSVARWYLVYQGGIAPTESQFQTLPVHAPRAEFIHKLASGLYRFVGVSNMFEDSVDLNERTRSILRSWPTVWRSDEHGTGPSRLVIYERPGSISGDQTKPGPISTR